MERKEFLKKSFLAGLGIAASTKQISAADKELGTSTYDTMMQQVGFNHLPNQEITTMRTVLHKAETRGHADHGWLNSYHSFSFANYQNPDRMHFGVLRVLNDDTVDPNRGFGKHPHDNMEIISIPLEGDLEHQDSMGNVATIKQGDVQIMSAGTGIYHSEKNKNNDKAVKFLQIWIFPNKTNVTPRYDQITLKDQHLKNKFFQILSPNQEDDGVWIHQNAWFHLANLEENYQENYQLRLKGNGVYAFVIHGKIEIEGQELKDRDGFGIWDTDQIKITAKSHAKVLLMEVPMSI